MAPSPPPRRASWDQKKQEVRHRLRAATLELGLARGLDDVRVEEIAAQAGVSLRTFFNYFDTKEDAALTELLAVDEDVLDAFAASEPASGVWADLTRLLADDVARADRDVLDLRRYLQLQEAHPSLRARQFWAYSAFQARLAKAIAMRIDRIPHPDRPAELLTQAMCSAAIAAVGVGLRLWTADGYRGTARDHVVSACEIFDRSFPD